MIFGYSILSYVFLTTKVSVIFMLVPGKCTRSRTPSTGFVTYAVIEGCRNDWNQGRPTYHTTSSAPCWRLLKPISSKTLLYVTVTDQKCLEPWKINLRKGELCITFVLQSCRYLRVYSILAFVECLLLDEFQWFRKKRWRVIAVLSRHSNEGTETSQEKLCLCSWWSSRCKWSCFEAKPGTLPLEESAMLFN
jgi:hypothetical protein